MSLAARREALLEDLTQKGTYQRWVLWTALAGMFATTFPVTVLTVSLSDIADEFNTDKSTLTWVISGPILLSALTIPVLGKMGDIYGHRRVFLTGSAIATATAFATAFAWDPLSLIGMRSVAQVVGGATQPTSMALLMMVFAPSERVKATAWWSMVAAAAPAVGLAVGGPLIDLVGWRSIFVVQALLSLVALALAVLILPETEGRDTTFDLKGAGALFVGVGGAMLVLSQAESWGFASPATYVCLLLVPVGLVAFVRIERTAKAPLLPLEFLRIPSFSASLGTEFFQGAAYMGGFVLAPLALRDVFGLTATTASAVMLLRTAVFSGSSPLGGRLGARLGFRAMATTGSVLLVAALGVFTIGSSIEILAVFAGGLALQGLAFGLGRPSIAAAVANSVPEADLGIAAAFQRMMMQIGNSFGIALLSMLYNDSGEASGFVLPFMVGIVMAAIVVFFARLMGTDADAPPEPEVVTSRAPVTSTGRDRGARSR